MKVVRIAYIGLAALSILAPSANAQQNSTTVTLVQKIQPVTRSYPGVAADVLGIQTGMTVSQAEAIAEKSYPAKPKEFRGQEYSKYREVTVESNPFLQALRFENETPEMDDILSLYFGSPVIGNTLYGVERDIQFKQAASAPLMSTLEASLIKKYGPPSARLFQPSSYVDLTWVFSQKSKTPCDSASNCTGNTQMFWGGARLTPWGGSTDPGDMTISDLNTGRWEAQCTMILNNSQVFAIHAGIQNDETDRTKAGELSVSIWDPATCLGGYEEASRQLSAAAINLYNSVSKTPSLKL